jgi:hypothetical protein
MPEVKCEEAMEKLKVETPQAESLVERREKQKVFVFLWFCLSDASVS